jgi:hypothetical protein
MPNIKLSSLNKGLVGHWTMAQDSLKGSLLADKTPYENDGIIHGATFATDRMGQPNKAMSFNGTSDYINIGGDSSLKLENSGTIIAWIYPTSLTGFRVFYGSSGGADVDKTPYFMLHGGQLRAYLGNGTNSNYVNSGYYPKLNAWSFVGLSWDGTNINSFYNTNIKSLDQTYPVKFTADTYFIGKPGHVDRNFAGSIDDVRIYNRALSETEIKTLYNSYNPNIKMKTSLPKIKLYGGDKEIKKNGFIRVDKNINNSIYFDNPESNLYGKTYFYVMQYQARNNGGVPKSTGDGLPWTSISQLDAIQKSKDAGYHLMTNWEWMAIARDIEQVPENWTGGAVGSGILKRGNVGTTDDGSYDGADPETGILNDKAKLKLSNGEEIYHFSGNVWEWVDDTITQGEQYINFNQNASNWYEFNATDLFKVAQKLPYTEVGPKETYATPSSNGLGRIYINTSNGSSANRAFRRGGGWSGGAYAGVFALDLNASPARTSAHIGFRCARYGNE